ncbi:MAG TPA: DNA-formamidopyrimidine glycosylase family protein [Candidatus Dormibacteraeota bacterium]|nr:DNA-formamidopyrimidine glycosylase family protein [Candidatus Dormibacteraeota bacterium]
MPEGDTIWRTAAALREHVGGRTVLAARPPDLARLEGRVLERAEAAGKHLLLHFTGGLVLHSHLRMRGAWHLYRPGEGWRRPCRQARAVLDFGPWVVVCFAAPVVELVADVRARVGHLGPDICAPEFPLEAVVARARALGPRPIGEVMLDQRVCSGIGNVYRCEVLWELGLNPWRSSAELSDEQLGDVFTLARTWMRANLRGGAMPRRFAGGRPAAVHGRGGRPCPRCGGPVQVRRLGEHARLVYHCPTCQA